MSVAVVRSLVGAVAARDVDAVLRHFTGDASVEFVPLREKGSAADAGRRVFAALFEAFPDLLVDTKRIVACTDGHVALELKLQGTQAAPFFEIVDQEKHIDLDQAWLVTIAGDAISRLKVFWCQNQLFRRLAVKRLDRVDIATEAER